MSILRFIRIALILSLVVFAGCERKIYRLRVLEQTAAGAIEKSLDLNEGLHPGVPITNLPQVFDGAMQLDQLHRKHPAFFEMEFRKFGRYAGFTNSFYEKYVRVPPGVTNRAFPREAIFMNAQPFPDYDGHLGRMVVWREAPQRHRNNWVPEEQIQEAFKRAGVTIPKAEPMPKPPYPGPFAKQNYRLKTRVVMFFKDFAGEYGPGRELWFPTMLVCLGLPLLIAVIFVVWFLRRSRRQ